ncbi:hypothetical protein KEU06_04935 [Pseudaminobacter sp. 19-2017]|uniref:Uncharacterized protein n=1 Tax=Pseudaminobacter soli (ex Zhang et al. 2022) TaxID=2831468 RepID=A0A942I283_9HYPH|nr:hypothetical protein [Pseudaminobacter soli]MBS3647974.1 hypothetical protein [Pseudaminobacter soli]
MPAFASDRWEEAGSGAVAILPVPLKSNGINGGSLVCAEQRWTMRLRTDKREAFAPNLPSKVTIDGRAREIEAEQTATSISIPITFEFVRAIKAGARLQVSVGSGADGLSAAFALRNSQRVIDAVAPRCSPIDMSPYVNVALAQAGPPADQANKLLAKEVELFRTATTATPVLSAAIVERGGGHQMLFASLCGSAWYYGRSGCTLFGYARTATDTPWREIYHSEGMSLYLDPNASSDNWPELVTVPSTGETEQMHWAFDRERYALRDEQIAKEMTEPLRGTMTP